MFIGSLLLTSLATASVPSEEVVVFGEPFAQWDGTRWAVRTEQVVPTGIWLGTRSDRTFFAVDWQVDAVVACELDGREGPNRRDVRCRVEESALRVAGLDRWQRASDREWVQTILEEIDVALADVSVWLRVGKGGQVVGIDVEQSDTFEPGVFEHIAHQIFNPFHLHVQPYGLRDDDAWLRTEDPLLRPPRTLSTRGHVEVAHFSNAHRGHWVVQTRGESSIAIVYDPLEDGVRREAPRPAWSGFAPETDPQPEWELPAGLRLDSVSLFDLDDQLLRERVWTVRSGGISYTHTGTLRRLPDGEAPDLGVTAQLPPPPPKHPMANLDNAIRLPFPTQPIFEGVQRVCINIGKDLGIEPVEVDDGPFTVSCDRDAGRTIACLQVDGSKPWPERMPTLVCPGTPRDLTVRPILAFDPTEDISDGVEILRRVTTHQATFVVPELPDAPGLLEDGSCGVSEGLLWVALGSEARRQTCTLILPDDSERQIPITLVDKLSR